ncbi:glycerophosphoryl diester phosphodiesterase membrane domain-containing protein [Mesorhizobium sp. AR02]|uniref:glycerophosphoryl diester phosphodiesterase membrane domain-containing protein n=1 Tax=Mesorhizobium sp. AR02 TaxID=2865837 RepID=UPI002160A2CA|nr:glycerophosphoryl diester phosphodiesterase membrane domain-containing protein [Mesorhizobium sp. AR02]UVK53422.1 glycerophosphoryl diester phosphodiesterase membrane domain-containing protein [Mesorhizobium sp. AR02]
MSSAALERVDRFRIGRVLNDSLAVIRRNPVLCLGLGLVLYAVPRFAFSFWYVEATFSSGSAGFALLSQHRILVIAGVLFYIGVIVILQTALIRAAIVDMQGEGPSMGDCLGVALAMFFPVLLASCAVTLAIMLGLVLLIVPGILLLLRWAITIPVLIQEKRNILDSMARSRDLTKGNRWALLGLWLILIVGGTLVGFAAPRLVVSLNFTFGLIVEALVKAAVTVFSSVATAISYIELRQVKEGTSVEQLAEIFS